MRVITDGFTLGQVGMMAAKVKTDALNKVMSLSMKILFIHIYFAKRLNFFNLNIFYTTIIRPVLMSYFRSLMLYLRT